MRADLELVQPEHGRTLTGAHTSSSESSCSAGVGNTLGTALATMASSHLSLEKEYFRAPRDQFYTLWERLTMVVCLLSKRNYIPSA